MKQVLIEADSISSKMKVLDFECSTSTLTIMVKELYLGEKATGVDVNSEIL